MLTSHSESYAVSLLQREISQENIIVQVFLFHCETAMLSAVDQSICSVRLGLEAGKGS